MRTPFDHFALDQEVMSQSSPNESSNPDSPREILANHDREKQTARVDHWNWTKTKLFALSLLLLIFAGVLIWIVNERRKDPRYQARVVVDSLKREMGASFPAALAKLKELPPENVLSELRRHFESARNLRYKVAFALALAHFGNVESEFLVSSIYQIDESDRGHFLQALRQDRSASLRAIGIQKEHNYGGRHQAQLAIAALNLGDASLALEACAFENRPDPVLRTYFIDEFPRWENDLQTILALADGGNNAALRSALCLSVGSIPVERLSEVDRKAWGALALRWFVEEPDSSIHSASGWHLRSWGLPEPKLEDQAREHSKRSWFMNSVGATMLRIPGYERPETVLPDPIRALESIRDSTRSTFGTTQSQEIISNARYHYESGNVTVALAELDRLEVESQRTPLTNIIEIEESLRYRTLALARVGKADEAYETFQDYLAFSRERGRGGRICFPQYLEIQIPAWLGDYDEALRKLEIASSDPLNKDPKSLYWLSRAASRCAQASSNGSPAASNRFLELALNTLEESVAHGNWKPKDIESEIDFANLHQNSGFAAILANMVRMEEFWVSDREVTRGQFELFMNDSSYPEKDKPSKWPGVNPSVSPSVHHPVHNVSWDDSALFCNWLSLREGRTPRYERTGTTVEQMGQVHTVWREIPGATGYRLPRLKEWEYACRAGTTTFFSMGVSQGFGDEEDFVEPYCHSQIYRQKDGKRIVPTGATPCGNKKPNAWGLHDCHGNVLEFSEDLADGREFGYPISEIGYPICGGSWSERAESCGSASHGWCERGFRASNLGFRIALGP